MSRTIPFALAALLPGVALAANPAFTNISISANVVADCTISATAMDFGFISGQTAADHDAQSDLSVNCAASVPYRVFLSANNDDITDGTNTINVDLFTDAGRTTAFPTSFATGVAGTGTGAAQTVSVFGRILSAELPKPAGVYNNTGGEVTASVQF